MAHSAYSKASRALNVFEGVCCLCKYPPHAYHFIGPLCVGIFYTYCLNMYLVLYILLNHMPF